MKPTFKSERARRGHAEINVSILLLDKIYIKETTVKDQKNGTIVISKKLHFLVSHFLVAICNM